MKRWAELKAAFWAAVDGDPAERSRQIEVLASIDPELPGRLEALLAADARGESLQHLFQSEPVPTERPARIGAYDVIGVLGVGGMGDVYRARDVRLHREVAIKVLPAAVANDHERLARFEHEAQVLASLNHPHIAQIYGLDESGNTPALVMELVEGPTLAQVIASDPGVPLTLVRALTIARQIADGLDSAHLKGIIHRDLKPSNVALTQEGDVKVLDFGVAKSLDNAAPKSTGAAVATDIGVVIGTPAYMSPEQARAMTVDKRTDIWAFGCLLYELLTGRQAFGGITASDSLAAVLERDPDMTFVPAEAPAILRSLLRHCLEKDPKRRLRDIGDARLVIDDVLSQPDARTPPDIHDVGSTHPRAAIRVRVLWLLAGIGVAAATAILVRLPPEASPADQPRRMIVSVVLPRSMHLAGSELDAQRSESRFAVSPDGRKLALIAADESGRTRLWLRVLASAAFQPLPETDDASFPFWSPDSESIGFVAAGKLKAVRLSGTPMTVNETAFRTGAWSQNVSSFSRRRAPRRSTSCRRQAARATPATRLDKASGELQHGAPAFLPDGRHFLYFSIGNLSGGALDPRGIYLGSLDAGEAAKLLLPGATQARYANGHVLLVQNGTLMAQSFDLESKELRGAPAPLVEDVKLATAGAAGDTVSFSVSDNGVLVYQAAPRTESRPISFDRDGKQLALLAAPADYSDVALSPDGAHLAVSVRDPARSTRDLWLYDMDGARGRRLTFDPADEFAPVWSPDGTRLLFSSMTGSLVNLHVKEVNRMGDALHLEVDNLGLGRYAADWSRDGRYIMYIGGGRAISRSDLLVAPIASPREARALLDSPFVETQGRFAPSGGWFAYPSNETGQLEVYVDRFPEHGGKRLVSTSGGGWPRWATDGSEIFYLSPDNNLMAVAVHSTRDRLDLAAPRRLFAVRPRPPVRLDAYPYDVSPDGQRFVVNTLIEDTTPTTITVMLNWTGGLTKR